MREILLFHMRKGFVAALACLSLSACGNTDVRFKVLIGATTITASGESPIDDSIIVVAGRKIRSVGKRKDVAVPQNSDRVDLRGKWIVPESGSTIGPGEPANLIVLDHAPGGIAPANAADIESRLVAGEWKPGH